MHAGTSTGDIALRPTTGPHGASFPLGATICQGGANFSVFSKRATSVHLVFFDRVDAGKPQSGVFSLMPCHETGWGHESHTLAATIRRLLGGRAQAHVVINAYWEALEFEIPSSGDALTPWQRLIDTSIDSPDDVCAWADAPKVQHSTYIVQPRSVVLLIAMALDNDAILERRPSGDSSTAPGVALNRVEGRRPRGRT